MGRALVEAKSASSRHNRGRFSCEGDGLDGFDGWRIIGLILPMVRFNWAGLGERLWALRVYMNFCVHGTPRKGKSVTEGTDFGIEVKLYASVAMSP